VIAAIVLSSFSRQQVLYGSDAYLQLTQPIQPERAVDSSSPSEFPLTGFATTSSDLQSQIIIDTPGIYHVDDTAN